MSFVNQPYGLPVRTTDPETSGEAAVSVRQSAGTQREKLLLAYFIHFNAHEVKYGLTSEEAFKYANDCGFDVSPYSYWKRISELQQMGLLFFTGETRIAHSGKKQRVYDISKQGIEEMEYVMSF